jgi:hypothetical protein
MAVIYDNKEHDIFELTDDRRWNCGNKFLSKESTNSPLIITLSLDKNNSCDWVIFVYCFEKNDKIRKGRGNLKIRRRQNKKIRRCFNTI